MKFFRWLEFLWQTLFIDQLNLIQNELAPDVRQKTSLSAGMIMCSVAGYLSIQEYYGNSGSVVYRWFASIMPKDHSFQELNRHIFWSLSCSTVYFLFPAVFIVFSRKSSFRDFGVKLKGLTSHLWIYILLYLIVLPAVIFVSYTPSFQKTYPFYSNCHRSAFDLITWWSFYGIQFFCLEFFFRGYILHGLKRSIGAYAIFFSAVPYCMIHFGKPLPETLGAIIAGVILGILSLRTCSIWSGFLIHISVAYSMDLLSMWQKGKFSLFM